MSGDTVSAPVVRGGWEPDTEADFTQGVAVCRECGAVVRVKLGTYEVDSRVMHAEWHDHLRSLLDRLGE